MKTWGDLVLEICPRVYGLLWSSNVNITFIYLAKSNLKNLKKSIFETTGVGGSLTGM